MQLKITTDYAIRAILYLATKDEVISSLEISEKMSIPRKYLINIMKDLKNAGLVNTFSGQHGGYSLGRPTSQISLFDIIETMEGTSRINRCLEDDRYCSRFATENCPVRNTYLFIQSELERSLRSVTIQKLLEDSAAK